MCIFDRAGRRLDIDGSTYLLLRIRSPDGRGRRRADCQARHLAAVRREVMAGYVGSAWGPAVGQVWDFLRVHPGLWTDGHNIFVYHLSEEPDGLLVCDFGVEVTRAVSASGEVYATATPAGDAVVAVHRGPYDHLIEAYEAIDRSMQAHPRESAGQVWDIYGDPTPDPTLTETTVVHLLK